MFITPVLANFFSYLFVFLIKRKSYDILLGEEYYACTNNSSVANGSANLVANQEACKIKPHVVPHIGTNLHAREQVEFELNAHADDTMNGVRIIPHPAIAIPHYSL